MTILAYYDTWDTVRTANDENRINLNNQSLAVAHVILSLLRGEIPVFSQTHGFDSTTILGAASASNEEGAYFRALVQKGRIRFHLFKQPTLKNAFSVALDNPKFIFSGWPEIKDGQVECTAIKEAISGHSVSELSDSIKARVETVIALNDSIEKAKYVGVGEAIPSTRNLGQLLTSVASKLSDGDALKKDIASLINQKTNNRSELYQAAEKTESKEILKEIIDLCYNDVIAESLGANIVSLTAKKNISLESVSSVLKSSVYGTEFFETKYNKTLQRVGWKEILEFLKSVENLPHTDISKEAAIRNFLAQIEYARGHWYYAVAPAALNRLLAGLVGGTAGGGSTIATGSSEHTIIGFIIGFLAGSALPIEVSPNDIVRKNILKHLQSRYKGILQKK